nr:RNA-directed DNA polymerase, eukaryota [Tanacetum cinerariifolium]
SKWGEVLDVEDYNDDMFARKRLCIKINLVKNILDSFKIIVKGKAFMARAKELFVWSPSFKDVPEVTHCSDVDSFKNTSNNNVEDGPGVHIEEESNCDAVSDTFFRDSDEVNENAINQSVNDKESSKDPFGIYELLKKSKADGNSESSILFPPGYTLDKGSVHPTSCTSDKDMFDGNLESSIPFPPGYTPDKGRVTQMVRPTFDTLQEMQGDHMKSASYTPRVFEEMENPDIYVQSVGKDGKQGLGSKAKKEWIRELSNNHKISFLSLQETKEECFSDLEIKYFWGNYEFDHVESEALGLSGGILCVWDCNVFHKSHHIISDNFVALYGMWLPKKIQWRGEYIVLGDFNEVRCKEERWGSTFHVQGARSFNSFLLNAGLNDVQLEGLKKEIRKWVTDFKSAQSSSTKDLQKKLLDINKILDQGGVTDDVLFTRMEMMKQLHDLNSSNSIDFIQKAKVRWAIEGDENSKFFHGVINRRDDKIRKAV